MDKSMTGDGAVVRLWTEAEGPFAGGAATREHNAAIRQQAAEIERLTRDLTRAEEELATVGVEGQASEARTADLLKALEEYGGHHGGCAWYSKTVEEMLAGGVRRECDCGLDTAIAAAKGETV